MAAASNHWTGRLRYTPLINIFILIFAIAVFGAAASKIIVYSLFMPFFTILQSLVDLAFHFYLALHPLYALVVSAIYFIGWLVQWSIWMNCEISGIGFDNGGKGETCFQINLDHAPNSTVPSKSSEGVVNARVGLGAIVIALYVAYGVMGALAVATKRRGVKGR